MSIDLSLYHLATFITNIPICHLFTTQHNPTNLCMTIEKCIIFLNVVFVYRKLLKKEWTSYDKGYGWWNWHQQSKTTTIKRNTSLKSRQLLQSHWHYSGISCRIFVLVRWMWYPIKAHCIDNSFFFSKSSITPNRKRIEQRFFSDEQFEKDRKEREEYKHLLDNQLVGQKSSSEIRQILRHKQKYATES